MIEVPQKQSCYRNRRFLTINVTLSGRIKTAVGAYDESTEQTRHPPLETREEQSEWKNGAEQRLGNRQNLIVYRTRLIGLMNL